MAKDQYVYAVARIRSKELSLLSGSVIEQLLGAKGYDECLQLLREKNWGDSDAGDAGAILAAEREKTWQLIGELACEALFGSSSPLYAKLYADGLVNNSFAYGYEAYPACAYLCAGGESKDPDAVNAAIAQEAVRVGRAGVDAGLFNRLKKAAYGARVRSLNSFESICINLAQSHFAGVEYFRFPEVFDSIGKKDVEDCIRSYVTPERTALAVVAPREERT